MRKAHSVIDTEDLQTMPLFTYSIKKAFLLYRNCETHAWGIQHIHFNSDTYVSLRVHLNPFAIQISEHWTIGCRHVKNGVCRAWRPSFARKRASWKCVSGASFHIHNYGVLPLLARGITYIQRRGKSWVKSKLMLCNLAQSVHEWPPLKRGHTSELSTLEIGASSGHECF